MIRCESKEIKYQSIITNGKEQALVYAGTGDEHGFEPKQLLEAALASCITIWLRMYADKNKIGLTNVKAQVELKKTEEGNPLFEYNYQLEGNLSEKDIERLEHTAKTCPVHQLLSKNISFTHIQK